MNALIYLHFSQTRQHYIYCLSISIYLSIFVCLPIHPSLQPSLHLSMVYLCMYIYTHIDTYIYVYMYGEREKAREREECELQYLYTAFKNSRNIMILFIHTYMCLYSGRQGMRWLDASTNSMGMNLSKLWETGQGSLVCCSPWGGRVGHNIAAE